MRITTEFLNLQTDFGFKYMFGEERNKSILIRFLNALLGDKINVKDVVFKNKEKLPSEEDGKRIIYDVYCTSRVSGEESGFLTGPLDRDRGRSRDHHFILEMQNINIPPFEERLTYYCSKMVAEQGKVGWNYDLEPVIVVAVTDFNLRDLSNKMVRDVMLMDTTTHEVLTEKVHIMVASLKEVPESWEECRTEMEEILFLIKNMDKMDINSNAYKEGRYKDMFDAARTNSLDDGNVIRYSDSLAKLRDIQEGIKYEAYLASEDARAKALVEGHAQGLAEGRAKGLAEGLAEGRAEGLVEGRAEGRAKGLAEGRSEGEREEKIKTAKIMLNMNLPKETILAATRLSEEELEKLL